MDGHITIFIIFMFKFPGYKKRIIYKIQYRLNRHHITHVLLFFFIFFSLDSCSLYTIPIPKRSILDKIYYKRQIHITCCKRRCHNKMDTLYYETFFYCDCFILFWTILSLILSEAHKFNNEKFFLSKIMNFH